MMTTDKPNPPILRRRGRNVDEFVGTSDMTPVHLAAVQADDALLSALDIGTCPLCQVPLRYVFGAGVVSDGGCDHPMSASTDAELARVLVAWRREVDAEPIGPLVDINTAADTISAARRPPRWSRVIRLAALGVIVLWVVAVVALLLAGAR